MNKVHLLGNLCHDPELRTTRSGTSLVNFTIAVNNRYKDKNTGEWKNNPVFVPCEAWGPRAEVISEHFQKGSPILIHGSLKFESWEKDGEKKSRLKMLIEEFEFLPGGKNNRQEAVSELASSEHEHAEGVELPGVTDDIPF